MTHTTRCPTCAMIAERGDHRQWIPLLSDIDDWRRCRNCGAEVDLGSLSPTGSAIGR
jgi:endogenous inhibitor of DNA gyrase (YacG/DUF329 family)